MPNHKIMYYQALSLLLFQQKQEQLSPLQWNPVFPLVYQLNILVEQQAKTPVEKRKKHIILDYQMFSSILPCIKNRTVMTIM